MKQHIRLAHDYTRSLHKEAVDRCTPLGLAAESPCKYCNAVHKQPRRHLLSCSAVYQASLAHLYVQSSEDPADQAQHDRGGPTIDCSSGGDGGLRSCDGAAFPGHGDLPGGPGTQGGCLGRMVQQGQKVPAEGRRWRQRNLVRLVEAQGAGGKLFGNRHSGSGNAKLDPVDDSKLVLRHESELAHLRREMGYMLFIDTEPYSCLESSSWRPQSGRTSMRKTRSPRRWA